jgi:hypothetical protein
MSKMDQDGGKFPVALKPTCGHVVLIPKALETEKWLPDEGRPSSRWWRTEYEDGSLVILSCPGCNAPMSLQSPRQRGHDIAQDGTVSPSVGCPQCGYHEFIKLEGWQ